MDRGRSRSHETLKVIDRQVALDARHHLVTILIAAIDLHHAEIVHHLSETSILQEVVLHRKGLEVVLQDAVQGARLSPSEAVGATEDELDHLEASHHAERVVLAHLWEQEGYDADMNDSRRPRSPPPKRERYASPGRNGYDRRGHSPARDAPSRFPRENNYRPRERSRTPPRRSAHASRGASPISSRRSSPPVHPDRMIASETRSPAYNERAPLPRPGRDRTPPRRAYSPARSPPRGPAGYRERSPPPAPRERDEPRNGATPASWSNAQVSTTSGPGYRGDERDREREPRNPPSGPSSGRHDSYAREHSSSGPPPAAPISMSAHNRPSSAALLAAPTQPRGGDFGKDPYRGRGSYQPSPSRGRGGYNAPPPPRQSSYDSPGIPTGPRSGPITGHVAPNSAPSYNEPSRPPYRSNNSSSTTYPRTQRFSNPAPHSHHLASVPAIVPGGKLAPSGLDPGQEKRLAQLEEDKRKLMEIIEEKQKAKRQGLREWEKAERESHREGLRSEFAEAHLERLSEGVGGRAAY
ncbi:hypothetical protein MMC09_005682 [Bachmanniomyces sp. S44760]|nr:hypothetical protein [Bachmanniomyces sp. S44760]